MIWDNDDFFGGMFDFDGDGKTDAVEAAIGFQILDEMNREDDEDEDYDDEDYDDDEDEDDDEDYDDDEDDDEDDQI